ncbi:hypothetical protein Goari_027464, partial [Gossypium aridum]|nr:hypothetical protein [Gossypium aridum]
SAYFTIAIEIAERFAYYGISSNLITFLTRPLDESTSAIAAQGLSLVSLLDALPSVSNSGDQSTDNIILSSSAQFQFDRQDPEECKAQSSFFNWWYFGICACTFITLCIFTYIQDNLSWTLGFGIPAIVMVVGLLVFVLETTTYRYSIKGDEENPFLRIGRVFILAVRNWKTIYSAIATKEEARGTLPTESSKQFKYLLNDDMVFTICRFLNKAFLALDGSKEQGKVCSTREVEKAKTVIRLAPIWVASLFYAIVYAQTIIFFTKQGATIDRSITTGFKIPAASLLSFISLTIMVFIPIYDRIFVPLARALTGKLAKITML